MNYNIINIVTGAVELKNATEKQVRDLWGIDARLYAYYPDRLIQGRYKVEIYRNPKKERKEKMMPPDLRAEWIAMQKLFGINV